MPLSPTSAPINELLTNIGVLVVALSAAVAGIYTGIQKAKKALRGEDVGKEPMLERKQVLSAAIIETVTLQQWTAQNQQATEQTRHLCTTLNEVLEELRSTRSTTRDFSDEVRKLRLAVSDLAEIAKAFRR